MCCPCSGKIGALLVGIIDLIVGSAGLSAVCFLLYIINDEINKLKDDSPSQLEERLHVLNGLYWSIMLSYVFPAAVTVSTGILAIFAVSNRSDCCAITSILLSGIMVFACAGILLILHLLGIEFPFLIPLIFGTALHTFFTFVLCSFRTSDLKTRHTV